MSIKAGQFLHDAQGFVLDRIQTGGVSNLNIPEEKIYELGNFESVATVRDIPELTFDVETFDVFPEFEAILTGQDPSGFTGGEEIDFRDGLPIDVISPFKSGLNQFDIVRGISVPYLTLESASYRMGVGQNATQSFSLRGDSIFYIPGSPYYQEFTLSGNGTGPFTISNTAIEYNESGNQLFILSACLKNETTGVYRRLHFDASDDDGYTNTNTTITTNTDWDAEGTYTTLHVTYGSVTAATYNSTVHEDTTVKPAAVRAKDICVYVEAPGATPNPVRWTGVQSFEANWRVTLENDEEFCNPRFVGTDYDVPEVDGNITVKPVDPADLWDKVAQVTNVPTDEVAGLLTSIPLEVTVVINDPDTGSAIKTLFIEDARFQPPAAQGRVQSKLEVTFPFTSDGGNMLVYNGAKP